MKKANPMKNLFYKKKGFLLIESLVAISIIGFAIATITQILLVKISRMHYTSKALKAQLELLNKLEETLALPEEKISSKNESTTQKDQGLFSIKVIPINEKSSLEEFKKNLDTITISIKANINDKQETFSLYSLKLKGDIL